jgi:hypothetical protein
VTWARLNPSYTTHWSAISCYAPRSKLISRRGQRIQDDLGLPLIVKLNAVGGSVGIDGAAVKETREAAQQRADALIGTYRVLVKAIDIFGNYTSQA